MCNGKENKLTERDFVAQCGSLLHLGRGPCRGGNADEGGAVKHEIVQKSESEDLLLELLELAQFRHYHLIAVPAPCAVRELLLRIRHFLLLRNKPLDQRVDASDDRIVCRICPTLRFVSQLDEQRIRRLESDGVADVWGRSESNCE